VTLRTADDGFSLIDMIFVCGMIGILATIAVPRLLTAKNSASAASAIATMRTISTAQLSFAISCGNGFYAPDLPSLSKPPVASNTGFVVAGAPDTSKCAERHLRGHGEPVRNHA
jgi:type II secretory pathway pseudopilin PulG